ncbi:Hypothetical protein Tpal_2022 [Trichococcus palustris]|uniref:O-antigen ligase-related n=2 Tax=Trichococcus palustris TaxID=140314 RepID=A0A143YT99_9LACT|nr:Hypothetical protein Tpal_2022 [Trichococcus palustris]SFK73853.1 hypothetical protein SAMN04488076_10459 [Trichococcus palustris]
MASLTLMVLWWYMLISPILIYWMQMPRVLLYIGDVINFFVFLLALVSYNKISVKRFHAEKILLLMLLFSFVGILSAIINQISVITLIWGIRSQLRFFAFFFSCIVFLKMKDVNIVLNVVKLLFWISLPLTIIEAYFVTYPAGTIIGDMVGGFYYNFSGSNLPLNAILLVEVTGVTIKYFTKNIKISTFLLTCAAAMVMATMAELKVYFIEFAVIIILCAIWSKVLLKGVITIALSFVIIIVTATMFTTFNGNGSSSYNEVMTVQGFIEYATRDSGYDGVGDLNRLTGIRTLRENLFRDSAITRAIGIGMGGGEYTNFFVSDFYKQYNWLHYQWFQAIWTYVETGTVGIVVFVMIFFVAFRKSRKDTMDFSISNFVSVMIIEMVVLFFYNTSLRAETAGFLLYLIIAIPYIYEKEQQPSINKLTNSIF